MSYSGERVGCHNCDGDGATIGEAENNPKYVKF